MFAVGQARHSQKGACHRGCDEGTVPAGVDDHIDEELLLSVLVQERTRTCVKHLLHHKGFHVYREDDDSVARIAELADPIRYVLAAQIKVEHDDVGVSTTGVHHRIDGGAFGDYRRAVVGVVGNPPAYSFKNDVEVLDDGNCDDGV